MAKFFALALLGVSVATFGATEASAAERWTVLARRVGQSEEFRARAIRELKNRKNLSQELRRGLKTSDRPLALEVISALEVKSLVPDMIALVPSDRDGFLILGLNAMMTEKNQKQILATYSKQLTPQTFGAVSAGALVAILEPYGRLGIKLPPDSADLLEKHKSPEVRGSLLYYVRVMALRHRNFDHVGVVDRMARATEYQLRYQAESIRRELQTSRTMVSR